MTLKNLVFAALALAGSFAACKEKPADKSVKTGSGAVQVLSLPLSSIKGSWVGYFKPDQDETVVDKKTGNSYTAKPNKITLFIAKLADGNVSGYSVCAGNERPFSGSYEEADGMIKASLQEPGDNKYDGVFELAISSSDRMISGKWTPFNKALGTRHYILERRNFKYDTTHGRYLNSSTRLLTTEDVENMYKDELRYMRNEMYARHGYSFKLREMREQFDSENWYMPISTDVRKKLSAIEVKNEKLIKNFEKYAEESYDDYGR
ncbi:MULTISPECIES: YARHG domain-containing protein [Niastella]|uniref:YARHG domain-containing protein n=1 Tax=Niastella soli TaxID=2821487 RepID=A0ABS3YZW9_9BACT|nr:YARHG domain-containing protein [Niastella soli]MBO9203464.1 YARHG domain-containing protein [Niastella soli]